MRIAVVGARGQLGAAMVQQCRQSRAWRSIAPASTSPTGAGPRDARPRPTGRRSSSTASPTAKWTPPRIIRSSAAGQWIAVRSLARAAQDTGTALVHYSTDSSSTALRRSPTRKTTSRIRAVSTARQNTRRIGSRPTLRARTCCASRRSLASPGSRQGRRGGHRQTHGKRRQRRASSRPDGFPHVSVRCRACDR